MQVHREGDAETGRSLFDELFGECTGELGESAAPFAEHGFGCLIYPTQGR